MKKLLLVLLVALGLQTQAQLTCDSITTTYLNISPTTIEVETNVLNLGIPGLILHSWDLYPGCQNAIITYCDTNVNAVIPLPDPIVVDTFVLCNWSDLMYAPWSCYSCDTFVWNGSNWAMMMQQPYFCCDSITYWTDHSQGFNIGLDTTNIIHTPDSMEVSWQICNANQCYSGTGMYDYFPQIMTTDTLKVCYDVMLYEANTVEVCTRCDSLIFDQNTFSCVLFNMSNPTAIGEIIIEKSNNKIYDLLGREIIGDIPNNTMYIQNGRKYIKIK